MTEKEYNLQAVEEESWGDDELTAIDISAPFLLEKADWTHFYNSKGFDGKYPFLLYTHEDADVLNDRLMVEVNRTQVLKGHNKLQVDLFTRFADHNGKVVGLAWLVVSGLRTFAPDLIDDLIWLLQSGTAVYLEHAYTSHGEEAEVKWLEASDLESINELFNAKLPPRSNLELADRVSYATILPKP